MRASAESCGEPPALSLRTLQLPLSLIRRLVLCTALLACAYAPVFDVRAGLSPSDEVPRTMFGALWGIFDLALLLAAGVGVLRQTWARAGDLLATSCVLSLLYTAWFIRTSGTSYLVVGIGAEQVMSWYLPLMALRIVLLAAIGGVGRVDPAPPGPV